MCFSFNLNFNLEWFEWVKKNSSGNEKLEVVEVG